MGSKSRQVREDQKTYWEDRLRERLSFLADKGVDAAQTSKDRAVRKIRARLRETNDRLAAIENREKRSQAMARVKEEKQSAPKKKKARGRKEAEQPPEMSKRQQKKKKKREDKGRSSEG